MSDPGLTGLTEIGIAVRDFERHLRVYRDCLGFEIRAQGAVPAEIAEGIWGVEQGRKVEAMQLSAGGSDSGYLRFIKIDGPVPAEERPSILDYGVFDFDIYTMDMPRAHRELTDAGYPWTTPPELWSPVGQEDIEVLEGWCLAPDGVNLVMNRPFQKKGSNAWLNDPDRRFSEVTASVTVVEDLEQESAFWQAMGLRIGVDFTLKHPAIDRFLELPPNTVLRMQLLTAKGSGPARVEIISILEGQGRINRTRRQRPGQTLGICQWAVRVKDMDAALTAAERGGGRRTGGPVESESPIHDRALVAAVETPAGVQVELSQLKD